MYKKSQKDLFSVLAIYIFAKFSVLAIYIIYIFSQNFVS